MDFLNPFLLAGTLLVALPVVLHLIMRQKPKLLEFPALRFIQKRHDVNRRRLMLRHLLLLALRAAAIVVLALALARPTVRFSGTLGSQEAPVAAALVFDAAPRMEYRHENRSRLEAAQDLGLWVLSQLPSGSEIAVLDTRPGRGAFQVDAAAARERIERLQAVTNSQPLTSALQEAARLVNESDFPGKEIYVFSDLARAAWPADRAGGLQQRLTDLPDVGIYVADVGIAEPTNFALGALQLSAQVLSQRSPLRIGSELFRSGPDAERTVELYLLDEQGDEQKRGAETLRVGPGKAQRVEFAVGGLKVGMHQGFLRIVGQDGLTSDDTRFFTVEVQPAWRVLVAAPEPAERNALFWTEALAPREFRRRGQARFDCDVVNYEELPRQTLSDYAAVCLLDPTPLEPTTWKKLGDFVSDGRGLAVFLGRRATPVDSFNQAPAAELLPGRLLRQARAPTGHVHLAPRDYQHVVLSPFRAQASAIPWSAFPVFRYWELGELAEGVGVVLPYNDGRPALLERPLAGGRVLTMTTPVSDDPNRDPWNLLPVGEAWPFLILAHRMTSYLVGIADRQLNYYAGQTAVLRLDARRQHDIYHVFAPGGLDFPLSADLSRHVLMVTSTDRVGNYRVRAAGRGGAERGFSVNLAPEQTRLERIAEADLSDVFGPFSYHLAGTRGEIEREQQRGRVGRELFGPLILLLALVLAFEYVVANRFYRE